MRSSYVLGSVFGIIVAAALWMTANRFQLLTPPKSAEQKIAELSDAADLAIAEPDEGFEAPQTSEDLLARRAQLAPQITVDLWDRTIELGSKEKPLVRTTACSFSGPSEAISVSPDQAEQILAGKTNVLFFDQSLPRCFEQSGKAALLIDDLNSHSKVFNVAGEVQIDRILERDLASLPNPFLNALKITKDDIPYLMNTELAPNRRYVFATILHVSSTRQQPLLDATELPKFMPGAVVLNAKALTSYFAGFHTEKKPVFVDARVRSKSDAPSYPGSIHLAFQPTQFVQMKFQPQLTAAMARGASFDMKSAPEDHLTPLIVFGADETDMAPVWLIRHLRQLGYRNVFFIRGGIKELSDVQPAIQF